MVRRVRHLLAACKVFLAAERNNLIVDAFLREASQLPIIARLCEQGVDFAAIARHLNDCGYRTRTGGKWNAAVVRRGFAEAAGEQCQVGTRPLEMNPPG
jgi:hypothetical protein